MVEPLDKAKWIAQGMEKRRALDVMILDMRELTSITEYFVICHGRSQVHLDAIAETVQEALEEHGIKADHREGGRKASWIVLDYGSAVAHVFTEQTRDFYDLERLWEDAPVIEHVAETPAGEEEPFDGEASVEDAFTDQETDDEELEDLLELEDLEALDDDEEEYELREE